MSYWNVRNHPEVEEICSIVGGKIEGKNAYKAEHVGTGHRFGQKMTYTTKLKLSNGNEKSKQKTKRTKQKQN